MKPLDRKLLRDVMRLKGQMVTIALVVAAGIAAFVSLRGTYTSLLSARATHYERMLFADVFASLERAPASVSAAIERIPGVSRVQTRVIKPAMMPLDDVPLPLRAQVISLEPEELQTLNRLQLSAGRWVEPGRGDEVLLLKSFADARRLSVGDAIPLVLNGKKHALRVCGLAMSAEYVFAIAPGEVSSDPDRFAVIWMVRETVAALLDMQGAFNAVALTLQPGASEAAVIDALDRVLQPYGGVGAYGRAHQPSNNALEGELTQMRSFSTVLPLIFLFVAALLVNVVLSRLVNTQRPEIATLKAVGYTDLEVGLHFFKLALLMLALGAVAGVGVGAYFGDAMVDLYERFFKFPELRFVFDLGSAAAAVLVSLAAGLAGAFGAVRAVVVLPPAEAMRPPSPPRYRRSIVDRLRLGPVVGPTVQMVVRELERRPLRTTLSAIAIGVSIGLMMIGGWYFDAIDSLVYTQFEQVMREDLTVAFIEPRPERALSELAHFPGVVQAEGLRLVPVRMRAGHVERDGALWGYPPSNELRQLRNADARLAALPPEGVVLTDALAEILSVSPGDRIEVDLHEGQRGSRSVVVTGVVSELFGLQGHMSMDALRRLLGESPQVNVALLRIDADYDSSIAARIKDLPYVASVTRRRDLFQRFEEQSAQMIVTMAVIILCFAATITVGVVYNNARVSLAMRARDLASLRVLGFTRAEIASILFGEMGVQVLLALPLGFLFGHLFVAGVSATVNAEQYRLPMVLSAQSYAIAILVALSAAAVSALLVRRRLDQLDLIGVLKTRE